MTTVVEESVNDLLTKSFLQHKDLRGDKSASLSGSMSHTVSLKARFSSVTRNDLLVVL